MEILEELLPLQKELLGEHGVEVLKTKKELAFLYTKVGRRKKGEDLLIASIDHAKRHTILIA